MISNLINPTIKTLDHESVLSICGNSKQAMVYGFGYCGYGALCAKLSRSDSPLEQMFDCSVGNDTVPFYTLEGKRIYQIDAEINLKEDTAEANVKICERMCKAGITNMVIENCYRRVKGLPLISVIFLIDSDAVSFDPTRYASRNLQLNSLLTHKELRRCYKLCCEVEDEYFKKVAKETFKFTKLINIGNGEYKLQKTLPFWERSENWQKAWSERQATKTGSKQPKWKEEVRKAIMA